MKGHLLNAFLALVFSVLIWSAVGAQLSADTKKTIDLIVTVPPDVTISYNGRQATGELRLPIEVELRGPREVIDRLTTSDISARHQFTREQTFLREALLSDAPRAVDIGKGDVFASRPGIEVVATRPAQVELAFSQVVEWEPRIQRPQIVGTPAPGFKVASVSLDRTRVSVRGPSSIRERQPGPYEVEPIDVTGERSELRLTRSVTTPGGVACDARVLVVVTIVPVPETRELVFPVRVLLSPRRTGPGGATIEPLDVAVEPRPPVQEWAFSIPLQGAAADLDALGQRLDRERRSPGSEKNLPVAYVRVDEFPTSAGLAADPDIVVVGLPEGITVESKVKFPIRTVATAHEGEGNR